MPMPRRPAGRAAARVRLALGAACALALALGCGGATTTLETVGGEPRSDAAADDAPFVPQIAPLPAPLDDYAPLANYAAMDLPADNPLTAEKAALGRQLYYDARLSGDGVRSCYSCHTCENGLTDGRATALGAFDKPLPRASPSLWNIGYHWAYYWDGRAPSLEKQAAAAWTGGNMGAKDHVARVLDTLNGAPGYRAQFENVFGGPATEENVPQALAAYMRTIIGGNTPFDRWQAGDESAVSEEAKRGWQVFRVKGCAECHAGALFTDQQFHNVGIGMDAAEPDLGRFKVSNVDKDRGAFKTPTLRDIAQSAPYFHDGSAATLEEAVDLMAKGGLPNAWLSKDKLRRQDFTGTERADLLAFLRSLDEDCDPTPPRLPPDGD